MRNESSFMRNPFQLKYSSGARHERRESEGRKERENIFVPARRSQNVAVRTHDGGLKTLLAEPGFQTGGFPAVQHRNADGCHLGAMLLRQLGIAAGLAQQRKVIAHAIIAASVFFRTELRRQLSAPFGIGAGETRAKRRLLYLEPEWPVIARNAGRKCGLDRLSVDGPPSRMASSMNSRTWGARSL